MLHTKFRENRPASSREEDFSGFYHIWAWWPSWSCDLDFAIKLSLPLPMDTPHKISVCLAKWFQRKKSLKSVWTTDRSRSRDDLDLN